MTAPGPHSAYLDFLSRMRPETVAGLAGYCDPQVRFRDPFHDVTGVERYIAICAAMFDSMHVDAFEITAVHSLAPCAFEWTLRYRFRNRILPNGPAAIVGASVVQFADNGRVVAHTDFWDASAILSSLPLVGAVVRAVKTRVARSAES